MKKRSILLGLVISLFLISFVSAGVYFTNPDSYYNLGDIIQTEVEVEPILEGFLKIDLVCDGGTINVFNGIPNEQGKVNISFPLTFSYIKENSGNCYFYAEYSGLTGKSRDFEISDALDVSLDIESVFVNPGEEFIVSGRANRLNGQGINGDVEIRIPLLSLNGVETEESEETIDCDCQLPCAQELDICEEDCANDYDDEELDSCNEDCSSEVDICVEDCETNCVNDEETEETEEETEEEETEESEEETEEEETEESEETSVDTGLFYGKVVEGDFSINIVLVEDTPAGNYRIDVRAYEQDSLGKVLSEGVAMASLGISQILTNIDIALGVAEIDPMESFNFKPMLLDQTGNSIYDEVSVVIKDKELNRMFEQIVDSGETIEYLIPSNLTSDYYDIEARSGEISFLKKFFVREKAIVKFELRNNTLIVTNIGNIPYKKDIQIDLNGKSFIKKVDLELQGLQEFKLSGSVGSYEVKISDGEREEVYSGVALTGKAVNVEAVKRGFIALNTPIVWIFFIIILGAGVLFLFRNILKKKSFAYPFSKVKGKLTKIKLKKKGEVKDKSITPQTKSKDEISKTQGIGLVNQAEQVLVLKGHKTKATILGLKIKNNLDKQAKIGLNKIIQPVYKQKGAVYERGEFVLIIFSPLMTKTYKNEAIAAKVAQEISGKLIEYNKKFASKIDLGIAINSGEIVNKIENKKLKFTALGNLIPGVKRIAESSSGEVLLTKEAYERSTSEIKSTKKGDVYEVRSILDREKNKEFIDNFLKRVGTEKNKKGESAFSLE